MAPIQIKVKGKDTLFDVDEHPRTQSTIEGLSKLKPVFKQGGTVTAGNASVGFYVLQFFFVIPYIVLNLIQCS